MQRNRHHVVVVNDHLLDDLGQELLACFFWLLCLSALLPVGAEVTDQIGSLMQLVVVDGAQGFNLALKLHALLEVLVPVDKPMIPPEIDAFDDLPDFLHALE
ncbi:MAG TPA: hypothetical protein PKD09_05170 [Aggregatilinea sp.]|uniref:hypothetical protein n=1 Tax=Aggregatilinea sp. TaxID=2806333 RepID=UPI002D1219F4|nr:hypothetical protein [Aggregatilinea sp.]HML21017.1 hypothetical protein [Aggregatilinea sp.]